MPQDALRSRSATATAEKGCAYTWASEPRPEISAELKAAMEAAGFEGFDAKATALGENYCDEFGWASTDYEIILQVESLQDRETLGNLFKRTLVVLDVFTTNRSDSIGVVFESGQERIIIRLDTGDLVEARQQTETKSGEELFDNLMWITGQEMPDS